MLEGGEAVLIDVREPYEYSDIRAKGATSMPLGTLGQHIQELPTDKDVLLICQGGGRSARAAAFALQSGYSRVYNVAGGTAAWAMSKLPVERG